MIDLATAFSQNPMIAILRGLELKNTPSVSDTLIEAGFRIMEVPLNSPDPISSIALIAERHGEKAIIGAGTVLTVDQVNAVADAGGRIIVSPNMNPDVGRAAVARGLYWCPGVMTPSEAFAALDLGAAVLKFFPAEMVPPGAIAAMRAVLPRKAIIAAVGGITPQTMAPYHAAGTNGFGLGSALYKPGYSLEEINERAKAFVDALDNLT
ncbi:2-dehydro-3-deoxy-6-phosphogalactonate aldolase [Cohaesibacter gelatinilyticus]|uniref:2-keto-3-deoxy-phosphogalactonate aldolase n=1 Tax=Cohaesibacter gelatinilyticus TaxID=372072 RepID=A0A285PBW0_9HYPH|nr:2-dehydro-3-deoxy-6-phosphogalactonate aldolase [Cohaesibacter gelatinilyticus]SNZ19250.1 2-keto-3-deoxy-phosphogalactonate aldolase [Cohaesibacter gelatinilyticus]